jgi:ketosteroid isomerase-like protein
MRAALVVVVFLSTSAWAGGSEDVRALVGKYVKALAEMRPDAAAKLQTKDAVIVSPAGGASADPVGYRQLYGADAGEGKLALAELKVTVGDHVAWFQSVVDASYVMELMGEHGPNRKRDTAQFRLSGIAIDDHGWKIAAAMIADIESDTALYKLLDSDAKRPDSIAAAGDSPAGALGHWLYDGTLAANQSKAKLVIANGTAPGERGENAAAAALAKGWDKLKMWVTPVDSRVFGGLAFAWGNVFLPVKGKGAARMVVGAIAAKEGGGWKWLSVSFSPQSNW